MKTKLFALMLMAGGALFAQPRVSIGVRIGGPVVGPPPMVAYRPPCPGPGYYWVDGYYDEYGSWFDGYWSLPPYAGAYWIAPRYYGGRYYSGYWNGPRGIYRLPPRAYYGRSYAVRGYDRGYYGGYRGYDHHSYPSYDHGGYRGGYHNYGGHSYRGGGFSGRGGGNSYRGGWGNRR